MADSPLEPRFCEPEGWRWGSFVNAQGASIRFGAAEPSGGGSEATVVALPGLSEFCEKYFEVARDMLARNLSFWVIDWRGQGRSDRYLANPQKRHSAGFAADVADLHTLVTQHVQPRSGGKKLIMLAHSMGGHIGLRHLSEHPGFFACAALSAPMLGIRAADMVPRALRVPLSAALAAVMGQHYIFGGGDWDPAFRDKQAHDILTGDPARGAVHNAWSVRDPALQVGNVTFGWLHEALASCARLNAPGVAEEIRTPCLLAIAGRDTLVDNGAIAAFAARMPKAEILRLEGSFHEILMERDDIRRRFLASFDRLRAEAVEISSNSGQTLASR